MKNSVEKCMNPNCRAKWKINNKREHLKNQLINVGGLTAK